MLTRIVSDLKVSPLPDGINWELIEDFYFQTNVTGRVKVESGFIFDFASIPKIFRIFFSPATGLYRLPAMVHDYLYRTGICTRLEADDIFLELMGLAGVSYIKRYSIYWAVRVGGTSSYKEK